MNGFEIDKTGFGVRRVEQGLAEWADQILCAGKHYPLIPLIRVLFFTLAQM